MLPFGRDLFRMILPDFLGLGLMAHVGGLCSRRGHSGNRIFKGRFILAVDLIEC